MRHHFGPFCLDARSRLLYRDGTPVALTSRAFDVLLTLAERQGQVVSKEEIMQAVWGDTVVEDNNLMQHVATVRKALGEKAGENRFIATVPGRGYSFVAAIKSVPEEPSREQVTATEQPASPTRPRPAAWKIAAAACAIAGILAIAVVPDKSEESGDWKLTPLTTFQGVEAVPALSSDGSRVVFGWDGGEFGADFDLYTMRVGATNPQRLTKQEGAELSAVWSPDGSQLAFVRLTAGQSEIRLVAADGGPERLVVRTHRHVDANYPYLDWAADGKHIIFLERAEPGPPWYLAVINIESGHIRQITSPKAGTVGDGAPVLSPDGRTLAFIRASAMNVGDIYLLSVDEALNPVGEPTRLTADQGGLFTPQWFPSGKFILYRNRMRGKLGMYKIRSVPGSKPVLVPFGNVINGPLSIARRAERLVYSHVISNSDIWRIDRRNPAGPPIRLISSSQADGNPSYSPDGSKIAFASGRTGNFEIWICESDGSNPRQLTNLNDFTGTPRWSPDGREIAFDSRFGANADVWVATLETGQLRRLTDGPTTDSIPSWSADGKWVLFTSDRTGRWETWKVPARGGPAVQVSFTGSYNAFEAQDGTLYSGKSYPDSTPLVRLNMRGGEDEQIATLSLAHTFELRRGMIVFVPPGGPGKDHSIMLYDTVAKTTERVFSFPPRTGSIGIGPSLSPDGRYIIFPMTDGAGGDLTMVENFE